MGATLNSLVHGRDTPDTLRISARLELGDGPAVLSIPDTFGRFYALWLRDASGAVFASLGARTTGTAAGRFAVLGPHARGTPAPPGTRAILAPTNTVLLSGCIEAVGERDDEALRSGFELLQAGGCAITAPGLEARAHPDPPADVLHVGFDRDSDGEPLSGSGHYRLRFAPEAWPPVHGFWSLTTPQGDDSIGDRRGLTLEPDGSLPIYLQQRPPARGVRRSNWLRVPADAFSVGLHLYWPRAEALEGTWEPPPITRLG